MNLENTKEAVAKIKGRLSIEFRRQEKIEDRDFKREELLKKYTAKMSGVQYEVYI